MKLNSKKFTAFKILTAAMAIFCASCANNPDFEGEVSNASNNAKTLKVSVSNYSEVIKSSSVKNSSVSESARSIIADSFNSDGVKFYIFGEADNGQAFAKPQEVTFNGNKLDDSSTSKTVGTIKIEADSYRWDFTLAAIDSANTTEINSYDTMIKEAVLLGRATIDMQYGDTAKFYLSPDGLTKEASVALSLNTDGWDVPDGYSEKVGIYNLTTGEVISSAEETPVSSEKEVTLTQDTANPTSYAITTILPGTYNFKVTFTKGNKNFIFSDVIIILPGKTINNTVLIPNVIGVAPKAPTAFTASLVSSSEDTTNGYYTTSFAWARGSKNESGYELDILTLADETTALPTSNEEWKTAEEKTGAEVVSYNANGTDDEKINFRSASTYVSGSLLATNTTASLNLELGSRYAARLRAVNDAGESDYAYVLLSDFDNATTINRFRLTYNFNGGKYYSDSDEITNENATISSPIVEYHSQSADAVSLIQPKDEENGPLLKNGTSIWSAWYKADQTTKFDGTEYTGYENLDLYAKFSNGTSEVELENKADYEIQLNWISTGTASYEALTSTSATITKIEKDQTSSWKFAPVADSNKITNDFKYDSVILTVSRGGTTYYAQTELSVGTDGTTFTVPLSGLGAGVYTFTFTAQYGYTIVNKTIAVTVELEM